MIVFTKKLSFSDAKGLLIIQYFNKNTNYVKNTERIVGLVNHFIFSSQNDNEATLIPPIEGPCPREVSILSSALEYAGNDMQKKNVSMKSYIVWFDSSLKAYWNLPPWLTFHIELTGGGLESYVSKANRWSWSQLNNQSQFAHFHNKLNNNEKCDFYGVELLATNILNERLSSFNSASSLTLNFGR